MPRPVTGIAVPRPAGADTPDRPAAVSAGRNVAAILAGAALLLWPAWLNGYPLLFSDTGAFLAQTLRPWAIFDKPYVYGPLLHAFHWRVTLWGPALAQGVLLSWLLWRVLRTVRPGRAGAVAHLLVCGGLALATAAPWFTALLMPDILAPILVLALFLLGWADDDAKLGTRLMLTLVAAVSAAAHLAHLPIAAAIALLAALHRRSLRAALRCLAPLLLAMAALLASNLALHGRLAVSPYGAIFVLARLVSDGPAARTITARCPATGWHVCAWADRLPGDANEFLWHPDGPVWGPRSDGARPGGPISLAPEAEVILRETLRREPGAVLAGALGNGVRQLGRVRVGDALVADHLDATVAPQLALGFPAPEQARYAAARQRQGDLAAQLPGLHVAVLALGAAMAVLNAVRLGAAWARRRGRDPGDGGGDGGVAGRRLGLVLCVLVAVVANAVATGALSGPAERYQARIAWLLPLAAVLAWPTRLGNAGRPAPRALVAS